VPMIKLDVVFFEYDSGNFYEWFRMIKKAVSKDERAWFFSFKEKRAKTVSERILHAGENQRVFGSTDLILIAALLSKNKRELQGKRRGKNKYEL